MSLLIKGIHIDEILFSTVDEEDNTEPIQEQPEQPTEPEPVQEEPVQEPAKPEPKKTEPARKKVIIDKGKLKALYKAGWSVAKIADEMRCSKATIYRLIGEMGL